MAVQEPQHSAMLCSLSVDWVGIIACVDGEVNARKMVC